MLPTTSAASEGCSREGDRRKWRTHGATRPCSSLAPPQPCGSRAAAPLSPPERADEPCADRPLFTCREAGLPSKAALLAEPLAALPTEQSCSAPRSFPRAFLPRCWVKNRKRQCYCPPSKYRTMTSPLLKTRATATDSSTGTQGSSAPGAKTLGSVCYIDALRH